MKVLIAAGLMVCSLGRAQDFNLSAEAPAKVTQYVSYAAEQQVVPVGKRTVLELRFQVKEGFHVNSHLPKSELQIATRVELQPGAGVKVASPEYPAGKEYSFAFDRSEKLDVYTGDFVVKVPVAVAAAGAHEMKGELIYQACDRAACYPVKKLGIGVLFSAK